MRFERCIFNYVLNDWNSNRDKNKTLSSQTESGVMDSNLTYLILPDDNVVYYEHFFSNYDWVKMQVFRPKRRRWVDWRPLHEQMNWLEFIFGLRFPIWRQLTQSGQKTSLWNLSSSQLSSVHYMTWKTAVIDAPFSEKKTTKILSNLLLEQVAWRPFFWGGD